VDTTRTDGIASKKFSGQIGDVNVYDVYLTAQQIAQLYSSSMPPILEDKDIESTEISQESEVINLLVPLQNNTASYTNSTSNDYNTEQQPIDDIINATAQPLPPPVTLNGTNTDYIIVNEEQLNDDLSHLTLSALVMPDYSAGSSVFTVLSKEKSFLLSINNIIEPTHVATFSVFDGISWTDIIGDQRIQSISHIAAIINGSEISLYVNGTLQGDGITMSDSFIVSAGEIQTVSADVAESDSDVVIGAYISSVRDDGNMANFFAGNIHDVMIYKEALSESEIQEIYSDYMISYAIQEANAISTTLNATDVTTTAINGTDVTTTAINATDVTIIVVVEIYDTLDEAVASCGGSGYVKAQSGGEYVCVGSVDDVISIALNGTDVTTTAINGTDVTTTAINGTDVTIIVVVEIYDTLDEAVASCGGSGYVKAVAGGVYTCDREADDVITITPLNGTDVTATPLNGTDVTIIDVVEFYDTLDEAVASCGGSGYVKAVSG